MKKYKNFNARELTSKHAYLMDDVEKLPSGAAISPKKKAEIKRLQTELYDRLYLYMKNNVLPIQLPTPSKKDMEFIDHRKITREQIAGALGAGISFNFEIFSSLNTRVDRFKVIAATKADAWKEARKRQKKYPGRVKIKIS